jgi:integration host factor subunit beta
MGTVTKKALVDRIAESTGQKRVVVKKTIQEFLDQMILELAAGNRLEFRDFGVFELKERAARVAQNPKTLERVPVPAKRTVKFKVGRKMREVLDGAPGTDAEEVEIHIAATTADHVKPRSKASQNHTNHTARAGA